MSVDNRLARPIGFLLAPSQYSLAKVGWAASASAEVIAAARRCLLRKTTSEPRPSVPREGIADVIVLSDGRKRER